MECKSLLHIPRLNYIQYCCLFALLSMHLCTVKKHFVTRTVSIIYKLFYHCILNGFLCKTYSEAHTVVHKEFYKKLYNVHMCTYLHTNYCEILMQYLANLIFSHYRFLNTFDVILFDKVLESL